MERLWVVSCLWLFCCFVSGGCDLSLGGRTSHSMLSRLGHVCFLCLAAGRLSSYCCYLELMSTHLCSRCAPASQLLQSQSDVAFDIPNIGVGLLHLKQFSHYWWKYIFDFLVVFKLEEWVWNFFFLLSHHSCRLFSDKLNFFPFQSHFWRRFLCRARIDSLLIDRDCSLWHFNSLDLNCYGENNP